MYCEVIKEFNLNMDFYTCFIKNFLIFVSGTGFVYNKDMVFTCKTGVYLLKKPSKSKLTMFNRKGFLWKRKYGKNRCASAMSAAKP